MCLSLSDWGTTSSSSWLFITSPPRHWLWESSRKPNWDVPPEIHEYRHHCTITLIFFLNSSNLNMYINLNNMCKQLLLSDSTQWVVESAPESISVSSDAHLKDDTSESEHHIHVWYDALISKNARSSHTFSYSEEGRCLWLDSPPGMLNWG